MLLVVFDSDFDLWKEFVVVERVFQSFFSFMDLLYD